VPFPLSASSPSLFPCPKSSWGGWGKFVRWQPLLKRGGHCLFVPQRSSGSEVLTTRSLKNLCPSDVLNSCQPRPRDDAYMCGARVTHDAGRVVCHQRDVFSDQDWPVQRHQYNDGWIHPQQQQTATTNYILLLLLLLKTFGLIRSFPS